MSGLVFPQYQSPLSALGQATNALGAIDQLRAVGEARKAAAMQQQQMESIRRLQGDYLSGNQDALQQLYRLDPQGTLALQQKQTELGQGQATLGKTQAEAQTAERQEALRRNRAFAGMLEAYEKQPSPAIYNNIRQAAGGIGFELPEAPLNREQLYDAKLSAEVGRRVLDNPQEQQKLQGELAEAAAAHGQGTPEFESAARRIFESRVNLREAQTRRALMPPAPLIQIGHKTQESLEKSIVSDKLLLNKLDSIRELDPLIDDLATYQGRARTSVAQMADKVGLLPAGSDEAKRLASARTLKTRIGFIFQPIKVELTGAAAPLKEMADLEDMIINGNLGPVELRASIRELDKMAREAIGIRQQVLQQGIMPDDPRYGQAIDTIWQHQHGGSRGASQPPRRGGPTGQVADAEQRARQIVSTPDAVRVLAPYARSQQELQQLEQLFADGVDEATFNRILERLQAGGAQ